MSILGTLFGTDDNSVSLADKELAFDMLKDSKFSVTSLSSAALEAINPQLRSMLRAQLDAAVREHFELSDMAIKKGWYPAFDDPKQQLASAIQDSKQAQQQIQQCEEP